MGIEQFASECAIMKVHGSEVLDYVVDEGVQIYEEWLFCRGPMEELTEMQELTESMKELMKLTEWSSLILFSSGL